MNDQKHDTEWHGPVVLASVFAGLMVWTWQTWPDLLADFGRELYVAWRISEGEVLYHDLAYFNGPLSPYFNAAVFRLLGVSIGSLIAVNAILAGMLTTVLYIGIRRLSNHLTATFAGLVFLVVFAFGHLAFTGNYNYICPYSHEMTHGLALSIGMFLLLMRSTRAKRRQYLWTMAAGVCWGMVFLGKAELFVAATGGAIATFVWFWITDPASGRKWPRQIVAFFVAGIVPVALAVFAFTTRIPLGEAIANVAGAWSYIVANHVPQSDFYRVITGTDRPLENITAMGTAFGQVVLLIAAAVFYDRASDSKHQRRNYILVAVCLTLTAALQWPKVPLLLQGMALLFASLLMTVGFAVAAIRRRSEPAFANRMAILAVWGVFATLLLSKLFLAPRVYHYGFVLAMPAAILGVVCLLDVLPGLLCRVSGGKTFRLIISAVLFVDMFGYFLMSSENIRVKTLPIGSGADRILTYRAEQSDIGPIVAKALETLDATIPYDATLAVLPEGVMLNYLTRRVNPTGYTVLLPPELEMFGNQRILKAFQAHPPDCVVLINKDTTEYGCGQFGSGDYGRKILAWIHEHYEVAETIGAVPFETDKFGLRILIKRTH